MLVTVALAALALCASAAAHTIPGGGANPYTSTVRGIVPPAPGVFAAILGQDDRVWIDDSEHRTLLVLGYQGEPYLRLGRTGVFRNLNSPATYVNQSRYGVGVSAPSSATAKAAPKWQRISRGETYNWHDHRIHWMSTIPPPVVRNDTSKPHHVFDWKIPIVIDGRDHTIVGTLDYTPPARTGGSPIAVISAVILTLLAVAGAVVAVRILRRKP
jgi:hypothetical protein